MRARVDYSGFAKAYGGNFGSRLQLWAYPGCAVSTPLVEARTQGTLVPSDNDEVGQALTAAVAVDPAVDPGYMSPGDKYGRSNSKRMTQGLAAVGPDDKPLNLHHMLQTQDGPIAEVTQSMHSGNFRQLHWKAGTKIPSGINRVAFEAWKTRYWMDRAAGFGG
jgi:hypothetical protein